MDRLDYAELPRLGRDIVTRAFSCACISAYQEPVRALGAIARIGPR
jgi:hypothetical protein